ncbi:MAG: protein-glutamine glutaminase family protein [Gemmatimonadota bacterium]
MPIENTIVARIVRIDPPVTGSGAEMFRRYPDGFTISFDDDQSARLGPGDRAAGDLEILDELRRIGAPVFVEIDPDTREITRLLIPLVVTVASLSQGDEGFVVQLEISHARHVLRGDNPDFDALLSTLRTARGQGTWLIVTEDDDHEIIDARPDPRPPEGIRFERGPSGRAPEGHEPLLFYQPIKWLISFLKWCLGWLLCLIRWLRCLPASRAREMFDLAAATTCDPLTVPVPCIPFLYPDDGCWGRAHEMCRLFLDAGVSPAKVWIYGSLNVDTKNNPNCEVFWGWHVAPTLCVRRWFFQTEQKVIDPALFTGPVSKATWKGVQGDPSALLVDTPASVFYRSFNGSTTTDPTYSQTNQVLATYRLQLKNRSLGPHGPPPYATCP